MPLRYFNVWSHASVHDHVVLGLGSGSGGGVGLGVGSGFRSWSLAVVHMIMASGLRSGLGLGSGFRSRAGVTVTYDHCGGTDVGVTRSGASVHMPCELGMFAVPGTATTSWAIW